MDAQPLNGTQPLASQREMDADLALDLQNRYYTCVCCRVLIITPFNFWSKYRGKTRVQPSDINRNEGNWIRYVIETDTTSAKYLGPCFMIIRAKPTKAILIHEYCCSVLLQHISSEDLDLERLFVVCQDTWDFVFVCSEERLRRFIFTKQPIVQKPKRFTRASQVPQNAMTVPKGLSGHSTDYFVFLPMEIRMQIAMYLATADFLALRHASRSMAKVFGIQSFWKSRFHVVQDRGFLAYLADNPPDDETTDWRLMYRCTANIDLMLKRRFPKHSYKYESIWNIWILKSLWRNTQWLRQRCSMTQASNEQIAFDNHMLTGMHWTEFYAGLECRRASRQGKNNDLCEHCGAEHVPLIQAIPLEHSVVSLAVSILYEGPETIITGFELVSGEKDVANKIFGCRLPGGQVTVSLRGQDLRGFSIVSSRGKIHALRPIFFDNDVERSWVGQPELCLDDLFREWYTSPKDWIKRSSTKLVSERGIKAFRGKFDSYKMIGLSIA